ncbi:hypothetical protein KIH74_22915 [Kineosporia sp. J2-2]|uniref:Uncharacterized protein n=1 Tax=Kineosporia corallincola TaxID=2835133 RepID=A0ABS5TL34_9ACTN|nr:hypothetical protein [Kineosporia corallincola]MBT0771811.1 hypothetical protein [Kineosporia corallincola]
MDDVEIIWVFRPDDPTRQGRTERLPRDLAGIKVSEGLARYAPVKQAVPEPGPGPEPEEAPKKRVPAQGKASAQS